MGARGPHGAHAGNPEPPVADFRSDDLRLVAMRCAEPRRDAVLVTRSILPRLTKEVPVRMIAVGLATILATLALASSTFPAVNTNTLNGTVGPGYTITMNKKTVKAGTYVITIHDLASIHDFHLTGPGVDKKTSVTVTQPPLRQAPRS
jgi:hypothetical protein